MATKKKTVTKEELYENVVDITAKHGQGIPLFMLKQNKEVQDALDSLITEKKVKIVTKSYSHLPDDETICLEGVYCIEEELSKSGGNLSHMSFLRHLLGSSENIPAFGKTDTEIAQSEEGKPLYEAWLKDNKEGLDALVALKGNPIEYKVEKLTDEEKDFLTSRGWYEKNKTIKEGLEISEKTIPDRNKQIEIVAEIIDLKKQDKKHEDEVKSDIEENKKNIAELEIRLKINSLMKGMENTQLVQEAFKDLI